MTDPTDLAALTAELRALEDSILDPALRADPARLRALLAPDFTEFGASGRVFDRDGIVAALAAESGRPATRRARGFKVRLLAPGVALTTWRVQRDDGSETLRSSIWQRQADGRWLIVFHQGTLAARDDEGTL